MTTPVAAMRQRLRQSEVVSCRGVIRDGRGPRDRTIPRAPAIDPVCWNKEVVRALATRLPGGKSQVTAECKICKSVFYPCLCPGEDKLVAPKVVEAAEFRRIGKCQMGHLVEVRKMLDNCGMDKEVIHVIGPAEYNDNKSGLNSSETGKLKGGKSPAIRQKGWHEFDESGLGSSARKILWREGDIYVISDPDSKISTQIIELKHQELVELSQMLSETGGKMTVESSKPGKKPVKEVKVVYQTFEEAERDLKLQEVKEVEDMAIDGDGSRTCWEVKSVSTDGPASKNDVCMGQRLVSFGHAKLPKTLQLRGLQEGGEALDNPETFNRLDLDAGEEPWSCFFPDTHTSRWDDDEEIFPCELVFDQLIPKSCVRNVRAPGENEWHAFNMDLIEEFLVKGNGAELLVDWQIQERIDRNEYQIRHQHWSESTDQYDGNLEAEVQSEREINLSLYRAWVAEQRMTPGHLSFVFGKLESAIKKEMANFEEKKRNRLGMLLCKGISAAAVETELKRWQGDEQIDQKELNKEERRWLKHLEAERDLCIKELHTVFDSVPLYFLRNVVDKLDDRKPVTDRRDVLARSLTPAPSKLCRTPRPPKGPQPNNPARKRTMALRRASVTAGMAKASDDSEAVAEGKDMQNTTHAEGVALLKREVRKYLDGRKGKGRDARITAEGQHVVLPSTEPNEEGEDGRLSPKEFEKILIMSGMHWVSTAESNALFDSMDKDKSGKLNFGELLMCATRMARLIQRLQAHQQEQAQAGRILDPQRLNQEFEIILEMGDDLVGGKSRPVVPDSNITASSYFLDRPAYGRGSMWRSRLDCVETCWVGGVEQNDQEPWIQWEFSHLRSITAVVTMGRPDADCWVKEFKLSYASKLSDSDMSSDDLDWEEYRVKDEVKFFEGNIDRNTRKEHILEKPIGAARVVRLYITKFHGRQPSLRASLYGMHHESPASRKRRSVAEAEATRRRLGSK